MLATPSHASLQSDLNMCNNVNNVCISSNSNLSIVYFNARSLLNKIDYLRLVCQASQPDIVCIVESWLEHEIHNDEVSIDGYDVVRSDRNRHGGGVLIYISKALTYKVLYSGDHELELLVISVSNIFDRCICLGVLYRPPNAGHFVLDSVSNVLCNMHISNLFSNFVLLGDFNIDFNNPNHTYYNHLSSFMSSFFLTQVVSSPTRVTSQSCTLIDLALVSECSFVHSCNVIPPLANSDHHGLHLQLRMRKERCHTTTARRKVWRYNLADFAGACDQLDELYLEDVLVPNNIDQSLLKWSELFLRTMHQFIPHAMLPDRQTLPWLTKTLVNAIKRRNYLFKKSKQTGDEGSFLKYKTLRNKIVRDLRKAKQAFFSNLQPNNSKQFWRTVRQISTTRTTIPVLSSSTNEQLSATTSSEKSNLLNNYFSDCFNIQVQPLSSTDMYHLDPSLCPEHLLTNESEVYELLSGIDVTKSTGPDEIAGRMIRNTVCSITQSITAIFNQSIKEGKFPTEWKRARITPVPKSSDHSLVENFRPISILSILSKELERIVYDRLMQEINSRNPISNRQWGFLKGKSTVGALLTAVDNWHQSLEAKRDVCAVFFDLKKAFDSVPHRLLLQKLSLLGIDPYLLQWIASYLCERQQTVCVEGSSSQQLPVLSGVPQGSVLGPLLFLIYIDGVSDLNISEGSLILYADDIVLYRTIYSIDDYQNLQSDVDALADSVSSLLLNLNPTKCKYIVLSRRRQTILPAAPLTVMGSLLEEVPSFKYLGVWITKDLSWSKHISEICIKAKRVIGLIYRQYYQHSNYETLKQLYISSVRPHLEYAAVVWDPHLQKDINSLEKVQTFALRMCTKNWSASQDSLLATCELPSLRKRRLFLKQCILYQVVNNLITFPSRNISPRDVNIITRSKNSAQLIRPFCRTESYKQSFFPDAISNWNNLPSDIKSASSLCSFKFRLRQLLF